MHVLRCSRGKAPLCGVRGTSQGLLLLQLMAQPTWMLLAGEEGALVVLEFAKEGQIYYKVSLVRGAK